MVRRLGSLAPHSLAPGSSLLYNDSVAPILAPHAYRIASRNHDKLVFMDIASAELTKYAANAMLATRISFMNEISNICIRVGANVDAVRRGIGSDARIGSKFLFAGLGYGGSCFPKDVKAVVTTSAEPFHGAADLLDGLPGREHPSGHPLPDV